MREMKHFTVRSMRQHQHTCIRCMQSIFEIEWGKKTGNNQNKSNLLNNLRANRVRVCVVCLQTLLQSTVASAADMIIIVIVILIVLLCIFIAPRYADRFAFSVSIVPKTYFVRKHTMLACRTVFSLQVDCRLPIALPNESREIMIYGKLDLGIILNSMEEIECV